MRRGSLAALALGALFACEEDPVRPPTTGDGPTQPGGALGAGGGVPGDGGSPFDGGDDGGSCTSLAPGGAQVDQTRLVDDPPLGTGGPLLDGTYDLIEARLYVGVSGLPGLTGNRYQGSLRLTGTAAERALVVFTNANGLSTSSFVRGTLTASGPNATLAVTCPGPQQESYSVAVANAGATLTLVNQVTKEAFVWSKRP